MRYVKAEGETYDRALARLRQQYGAEVIVYNHEEIPVRGLFGRMMGKKYYRVSGALKEQNSGGSRRNTKALSSVLTDSVSDEETRTALRQKLSSKEEIDNFLARLESSGLVNREIKSSAAEKSAVAKISPETEKPSAPAHSSDEPVSERKPLPRDMKEAAPVSEQNLPVSEPKVPVDRLAVEMQVETEGPVLKSLREYLPEQEFSTRWIDDFLTQLKNMMPRNEWRNKGRIYVNARELLAGKVTTSPVIGAKKFTVFVGPTGVGKTTTIAKMAARVSIVESRATEMFTTDTYRIAATEQLKTYGRIMNIPVRVIQRKEELTGILKQCKGDVALIDTNGVNQNDDEMLNVLKELVEEIRDDDTLHSNIDLHLVVSCTSKKKDLARIMQQFYETTGFHKIIMTKIDETTSYGAVLEQAEAFNRPFSFFTNGQSVPEDYLEADRYRLAGMILAGWRED